VSRRSVSACLIVRNEAERLTDALRSVAFCDEIVVVDSGSTDGTVALARAAGARVLEHPWEGFARQRNVALDHARGDWVLEIDADERVTPALRTEILAFLADPHPGIDLCAVPLRERFLGAWLGPAAKYPRYRHRLLLRSAHRHDERRVVHEGITPHGPVCPLAGDLEHLLADGVGEALRDTWTYARLEARQAPRMRGPLAYVRAGLMRPVAKLAYRLLIDGGWRDGVPGLVRIALDCGSDALVIARWARKRNPSTAPAVRRHFGRVAPRAGPVRIVGLAGGERAARRALAWLTEAAAAGADVALVTDAGEATAQAAIRVRSIRRLGLLEVIRAVDAESQVRSIDLLVAEGRARLLARGVPAQLRGGAVPVSVGDDAATIVGRLAAVRR
jgi:hypothetical protein